MTRSPDVQFSEISATGVGLARSAGKEKSTAPSIGSGEERADQSDRGGLRSNSEQSVFEIELCKTRRRYQRLRADRLCRRGQGLCCERCNGASTGSSPAATMAVMAISACARGGQHSRIRAPGVEVKFAQPCDKGSDGQIEFRENHLCVAIFSVISQRHTFRTEPSGAGDQRVKAEHRKRVSARIIGPLGMRQARRRSGRPAPARGLASWCFFPPAVQGRTEDWGGVARQMFGTFQVAEL